MQLLDANSEQATRTCEAGFSSGWAGELAMDCGSQNA
jgi:hypothetical protein